MTWAPSEDSDQPGHPPSLISLLCTQWSVKDPRYLHADSEYSDKTGWMPRLISVFTGSHKSFCWFCHAAAQMCYWIIYAHILLKLGSQTVTCLKLSYLSHMSLVMRKPVFRVCDQVRLKPAYAATEARESLQILDVGSTGIILSKERTIKADVQADLVLCCRHMAKTGFLITWLI